MYSKSLAQIGILSAWVLLTAACGSGDGSSAIDQTAASIGGSGNRFYGGCNHTNLANTNDRQCREWRGSLFSGTALTVSCDGIGGTYISIPCPTTNLVGTCYLDKDGGFETRFLYYSSDFSAMTAQANCLAKDTTGIGGNIVATWIVK